MGQTGKPVGDMVVAFAFLDTLPVTGGHVIAFFLFDFSNLILRNDHGYHVSDHRTDGNRRRKVAAKDALFQLVFSFG